MSLTGIAGKVFNLINQPVTDLGFKLWDVRFLKEGASWFLRIFIDKDGIIDINDCTQVSRLVDPILDTADLIDKAYYLEVSSPGLERELIRDEHFAACIGKPIKVKLFRPKDGEKEFCGILLCYDGSVTINNNGEEQIFAKQEITIVRLDDANV